MRHDWRCERCRRETTLDLICTRRASERRHAAREERREGGERRRGRAVSKVVRDDERRDVRRERGVATVDEDAFED